MLMASLKAGLSFAQAGNAAAHALQYPIGARTATSHGLGVGLLAPYVLQYVLPAAESALADVATALGVGSTGQAAVDELARLASVAGIPASLAEIGVRPEGLGDIASEAASLERLLRNSPAPLELPDLERILEAAWKGERHLLRASGV
jgi:alcohol dehydrogenase